jgi:ribosome-associated toxin RatA of RatAB toxin-antitoxin module
VAGARRGDVSALAGPGLGAALLVGALFGLSGAEAAGPTEQERLSRGEIIVRTRPVPGSDLPEVTARGVIEAPPERVWALIDACGRYSRFMPRVKSSEEISRQGSTVVCRLEVELPFPFSNLVSVTRARHEAGPPLWSRRWDLVEGDYHHNRGAWELAAFAGNPQRTLALYRVWAVPKTVLPDAIVRSAQGKKIEGLFEALRRAAARRDASRRPVIEAAATRASP